MIGDDSTYLPGGVEGARRVIIRDLRPQIDAGEYPVKRVLGDLVEVSAAIFADSHDALGCHVLYRHEHETEWTASRLTHDGNDIWKGAFKVTKLGRYTFTMQGWVDHFATWHRDLEKRRAVGEDLRLALLTGADVVEDASKRATGGDGLLLSSYASGMRRLAENKERGDYICPDQLLRLMNYYPDLRWSTTYRRLLTISVDRIRAQYSTWYELFPRSTSPSSDGSLVHGTLRDCQKCVPTIASLGFDVLYLPPIHPVGKAFRKGRNNDTVATPLDVGSPWAIGAEAGGHKAIHPQLGSTVDFLSLVEETRKYGMEIALDIAFQCSPDHPYVKDHREWFLIRPDGTIQYAENPPKKYQDIYPLNFESTDWWGLWNELKSVFVYWIELGVRIFRVDNPHTKAFPFWEWVITEIKEQYPDVLLLAEAFTRPHPMYELAKLGFSQSYTYFTWRNDKEDLSTYLNELTHPPIADFFRPNFWPNTPDILPYGLQGAKPPAFAIRLVLASTLSASYGIYGSAFELCDNLAKDAESEEYLNSEKYELKSWRDDPDAGLRPLIKQINGLRSRNIALQANYALHFHSTNNPWLIAYSKASADGSNVVLIVVNLDPNNSQGGVVTLSLEFLKLKVGARFVLHERLSGGDIELGSPNLSLTLNPSLSVAKIYNVSQDLVLSTEGPLSADKDLH